jgi:hypothetical protein
MSFTAPQIDYAGLSPVIALTAGVVLAPLVICILALALYPQLILHRTDATVRQTVATVTGGPAPEAQLAQFRREIVAGAKTPDTSLPTIVIPVVDER